MEYPTVSVVLPVFNAALYLDRCLASIVRQSHTVLELLLVNDGSTDNSLTIAMNYAAIDSRIKIIPQENQGVSSARNNGLSHSKGEFVVFVDADDWLENDYLIKLLQQQRATNADLVCCGYFDYSIYGKRVKVHDFKKENAATTSFIYSLLQGTAGVPWAKLYRKSIIDSNRMIFNTGISMSEDLVFNIEFASYCNKTEICDYYGYNYNRLNSNAVSSNINESYLSSYEKSSTTLVDLWTKNNFDHIVLSDWISNRYFSFTEKACMTIANDANLSIGERKSKLKYLYKKMVTSNYIKENVGSSKMIFWFLSRSYYLFTIRYLKVLYFLSFVRLKLKNYWSICVCSTRSR